MFIRIDSEEEQSELESQAGYIPCTINGIPIIECMNDKTHLYGQNGIFFDA